MITSYLLEQPTNRYSVVPAWATLGEWLTVMVSKPLHTPLIDFGPQPRLMRVGVTSLNWYLMDLLGLRARWHDDGWQLRVDPWLLINPLRYRLLGHQPRRPYAEDVRDYLAGLAPQLLNETLDQHAYFAMAPTVYRDEIDDRTVQLQAAYAPWNRVAVLDHETEQVIGMVWSAGPNMGDPPPILKPPYSIGSVTYSS
ncbi:MAG: hypothetical protein H6673_07800 [Anaerolineales bacterium]|nr:hypothetical protein [Anaerolineales bacterium]